MKITQNTLENFQRTIPRKVLRRDQIHLTFCQKAFEYEICDIWLQKKQKETSRKSWKKPRKQETKKTPPCLICDIGLQGRLQ